MGLYIVGRPTRLLQLNGHTMLRQPTRKGQNMRQHKYQRKEHKIALILYKESHIPLHM
jgi:hypothetical protein